MSDPILSARALQQRFPARNAGFFNRDTIQAVDNVDLDIHEGETLAIVGESGSGKSSLARLLLALVQPTGGTIAYRGIPLPVLTRLQHRAYRRDVQAVFQDPSSSLNPRMRVQDTIGHVLREHRIPHAGSLEAAIAAILATVGLGPECLTRYPHQLSGGQQQRVAIARAMTLKPRLIIADEPLSSLDISVQTQLLDLMAELKHQTNVGLVIISHDLGAVASIADRVAVMYRGRIVEIGSRILHTPRHPYTQTLIDAKLIADPRRARARQRIALPIDTKSPAQRLGCLFRHRCPHPGPDCATVTPILDVTGVACHHPNDAAFSVGAPT
jgi:oligopeptide/dipeptide ABC transporter ATP-binding protein